jgi:tRNA/tmRNA/rRNA uracil-C5-methylase (TrmA/RlmC/RlmD family)
VFVPFTAPGDTVEVKLVKTKKTYAEGETEKLIEASVIRVSPPCPVFEKCGGCTWQHLPYELQFETKKKGLLHALKRAGVETDSVLVDEFPAPASYHYRNRIQLHGDAKEKTIGFYSRGGREIVSITHCPIARKEINEALPALTESAFEKFDGEFKLEVEVTADGKILHAFNQAHAAFGFRQINDAQNEKLKTWVGDHILPASLLLDLYGGAGNLSLPLANRFKKILCVDVNVPATSSFSHFSFLKSDLAKWAKSEKDSALFSSPTSVILDPPREGLGAQFSEIEAKISKYDLKSLVLVGCDVDSFVRDTKNFVSR